MQRRVLFTSLSPTVTYIPTPSPTLAPVVLPTPLPRASLGLLVIWICVLFIFISIIVAIYRCLVSESYLCLILLVHLTRLNLLYIIDDICVHINACVNSHLAPSLSLMKSRGERMKGGVLCTVDYRY